ncbi:MAG: CD3324 family protein [Turicibacter sp.]
MKYEKAQNILPQDIVELIQDYMDGGYLYIPRKIENKKSWGEASGSRREIKQRNVEIFENYQQGFTVQTLANRYYLSESSIKRIIKQAHMSS